MSTSGINFTGLGSGIDTESIIQQLVKLEGRSKDILTTGQTALKDQQTAFNTISTQLADFQGTMIDLTRLRSFDVVSSTSSDSTVATITAQTGAPAGTHTLKVNTLAQTQRVSSSPQTSQTAPLGFSGQILVNGKAITVSANDTLQSLVGNINAANAGVTASILSPSAGQYYMVLGSNNSGLQGQLTLSDTGGGNFLGGTLGILSGTSTLRNPISTTGASTSLFSDSATSIGTLLGETTPASGNVTIGGTSINIDFATDSLSNISNKINSAGIAGVTASVVSATDPISGTLKQQLQINGTQSFTDSNNILANLGVVQKSYAPSREIVAANDASFILDGIPATRASNTFSDAIAGISISLLKDGGASTSFTVSADTSTIKKNISTFVSSFNDTIDAIAKVSSYDTSTQKSDPLFGDVTVQNLVDDLITKVTSQIQGASSNSMSLFSQAGITLDSDNHLQIDDTMLSSALSNNLQGVAQLFRSYGSVSDPSVQFVGGTVDTQPSGSAGYAIQVSQPASQATFVSGTAQTTPLAQDEILRFGGSAFGTAIDSTLASGYQLTLRSGSTLADIISQINGDSKLSSMMTATNNGGKLQISTKQYGSNAQFAILSSIADDSSGATSGIGTTVKTVTGIDVAGTINGEAATGSGQFLTGSLKSNGYTANGQALGLQLRITATTAGSYGTVRYSSGVADQLNNYISTLSTPNSGSIATAVSGLQTSIDDDQTEIDRMTESLKDYETNLRTQFSSMESMVSQLKASQNSLTSLTSSWTA